LHLIITNEKGLMGQDRLRHSSGCLRLREK